jgi:formimidoylglutamate deiminase
MKHLAPEYVITPQGLQSKMIVTISDDGRIVSLNQGEAGMQSIGSTEISSLPGVALLPGFVNTHSHVFQRALRGHTHRPLSKQDTFWTWRSAMYAEAQKLNPDLLYSNALMTYREMLAAGYTSVGEFHYVHHQSDGQPYADPNVMAEAIIQAGKEVGIRVVLLMTAYAQSGFNQPPEQQQRRFCDVSIDAYLDRVEALRLKGGPIGVAPHSVRAVPGEWFRAIAEYSHTYKLPLHVHADEQKAEIEQCLTVHGCTPIELLEHFGALGTLTTVIHATHANAAEIALLAKRGCTVCVCPTTEGDLGDGIAPYAELLAAQIPLAIGSDSNTRLDPIEELRWAEYSARMRYQRRRVLVGGELASPGTLLLEYGTHRGAVALGLETGAIIPGMLADFIAVDVHHPSLAGWIADDFLDEFFFGASAGAIVGTWVQGKQVCP